MEGARKGHETKELTSGIVGNPQTIDCGQRRDLTAQSWAQLSGEINEYQNRRRNKANGNNEKLRSVCRKGHPVHTRTKKATSHLQSPMINRVSERAKNKQKSLVEGNVLPHVLLPHFVTSIYSFSGSAAGN